MYLVSDDFLGHRSKFIREIAVKELLNQPKVGGNGDVVEVDECYLRGRRKANRGRFLVGNVLGHMGGRRNNYLARAQGISAKLIFKLFTGPWIFGLICRRTRECRMFYVQDRSAATLIPIIRANVAPGTTIISDEWRPYRCLPQYGFHHERVNHSQHFIDPASGASTQIIERQWRKLKLPLLKTGPGVSLNTVHSHLALFWWQSLHGRHVCSDPFYRMLDLISKHYPR